VGVLQTCVPTDGERRKAASLSPAVLSELSDAEAFVYALTEVPQLDRRLRAFRHRFQMAAALTDARDTLAAHAGICREVRRSRVLAEVLHATLRVGNFMNYGSRQVCHVYRPKRSIVPTCALISSSPTSLHAQ
jgi:hypothetical protein